MTLRRLRAVCVRAFCAIRFMGCALQCQRNAVVDIMKYNKIFTVVTLVLAGLQFVVVMLSWLVSAANPESNIRSLFGGEGLRWLFGSFVRNMETPVLVWLLLCSIAYGVVKSGGVVRSLRAFRQCDYRERMALYVVAGEAVFVLVVMLLLTVVPHAVLLSATGTLLTSSFSAGLIPVVACCACAMGATFGLLAGRFHSLYDVFRAMSHGVSSCAPLFVVYIFAAELYLMVMFVFVL